MIRSGDRTWSIEVTCFKGGDLAQKKGDKNKQQIRDVDFGPILLLGHDADNDWTTFICIIPYFSILLCF